MIGGAAMMLFWYFAIKPMGGWFGIYELIPGFVVAIILIVLVSLITKPPSQEVLDTFDAYKAMKYEEKGVRESDAQ
jgi:sodium/proline symporter